MWKNRYIPKLKKEVRLTERFIPKSNISSYPWTLCHHLQSAEKDASCMCGYRGGIGGGDGKGLICEMGSTEIKGEESLTLPRYAREQELANARLISVAPELLEAMIEFVERVDKGEVRSTKTYNKFKELIRKALDDGKI